MSQLYNVITLLDDLAIPLWLQCADICDLFTGVPILAAPFGPRLNMSINTLY